MTKVLVTGSEGTIGSVLCQGLSDFEISGYDLPERNCMDYGQLVEAARGQDALIHLAWDTTKDNWKKSTFHLESVEMADNAFRAALTSGVGRIVVASSVHADSFINRQPGELLDPYALSLPTNPYGVEKVMIENMGRYYAREGLEVVNVRFGAVNPNDNPNYYLNEPEALRRVWLSHRDCVDLIRRCVMAEVVPDNFAIVYGVSNNSGSKHATVNPFGWVPQDDVEQFINKRS